MNLQSKYMGLSLRNPLIALASPFSKVREHYKKMEDAGADTVMLTSSLLTNGIWHLQTILREMSAWMDEHDYESVNQMIGSMSQKSVAEPAAFECANYIEVLQSYKSHP
ncbi:MAG TPA: hypothetical protein ENN84_01445 [Candidatus Marinimicrobia bacterium]|nr:hypothetical protein [Candidatus Neomarinimicrobiota bacterium]